MVPVTVVLMLVVTVSMVSVLAVTVSMVSVLVVSMLVGFVDAGFVVGVLRSGA